MRLEPYRQAYDQAITELTELTQEFDRLRLRKDQIEKLLEAFRPLIGEASAYSETTHLEAVAQ